MTTPLLVAILGGGFIFAATVYIGLRSLARRGTFTQSNQRFLKRFGLRAGANLYVPEGKGDCLMQARVVDISDEGVRIVSPVPLSSDLNLYLELPKLQLAGTAKVKTCNKDSSAHYVVGLQFTGPLFRAFNTDMPDSVCYRSVHGDV